MMKMRKLLNNSLIINRFYRLRINHFSDINKDDKEQKDVSLERRIDPREIMQNINLSRFTTNVTDEDNKDLSKISEEKNVQPRVLTRSEKIQEIKKILEENEKKEEEKRKYKMRVAVSLAIF